MKASFGTLSADRLEALGDIAEKFSRSWGHLTTRQTVHFHFVQLEQVPALMGELARVGLTTREVFDDAVRNVMGCHLTGARPLEVLDVSPWAEATFRRPSSSGSGHYGIAGIHQRKLTSLRRWTGGQQSVFRARARTGISRHRARVFI